PTTFAQTYTASQVYGVDSEENSLVPEGLPPTTPMFGIVTYNAPTNAGGGVPQNTYNIVGRVDYNLSDKSQMFFRYVDYKEVDQTGGGFASPYSKYDVGSTEDDQAYLYNFSHDFSQTFVTNTKLSFSRFNTSDSYNTALQNVPTLDVAVN